MTSHLFVVFCSSLWKDRQILGYRQTHGWRKHSLSLGFHELLLSHCILLSQICFSKTEEINTIDTMMCDRPPLPLFSLCQGRNYELHYHFSDSDIRKYTEKFIYDHRKYRSKQLPLEIIGIQPDDELTLDAF